MSTKLLWGFSIVALIGAVVGLFAAYNIVKIGDGAQHLHEYDLMGISYAKEANIDLIYINRSMRDAILATTAEQRSSALKSIDDNIALTLSNLEKARPLFWSDAGKEAFDKIDGSWKTYIEHVAQVKALVSSAPLGQQSEAVGLVFGPFLAQAQTLDDQITASTKVKEENAILYAKRSAQTASFVTWAVVGGSLFALVLGIVIGILFSRGLMRQLGGEPAHAVAIASRIAEGDLSHSPQVKPGDSSSIIAALKAMQEQLKSVVSQVRTSSDNIATGSTQIASGNADLSQRTEEQAGALEQTAATMEELSSTVRNNADNAKQANQLAQGAATIASQGRQVVDQVVNTMQGISESSRKIGDIIGVIDSIAFQTNILALNAAVEAARAGEQGRGFAVVAGEVRTLAQRSAEAAKEIKALIGRNVEHVEQGTALVDQAGKTMGEIVGSIHRVSDIVAEISSATTEQSDGIDQVGNAVTQMDQVTQQNAALVEESAAAAEGLRTQAQQLVQVVSVFKLDDAGFLSTPSPMAPASVKRSVGSKPALKTAAKPIAKAPAKTPAIARSAAPSVPAAAGADDDWVAL
ncbi:methyl-accepting chemotaxis protein [Comamonas sp. GB3 AK4-5]|uniref:methyl-accepting chemotaxis protein n=1 Tax=Comamonas sp. GB3 AK4-5 TaxID=3231487 RepID=UPI00351F4F72